MSKKAVLMSLHRKWGFFILEGQKLWETRLNEPKLEFPYDAYIYETKRKNGCGKIIGKCTVYESISGKIETIRKPLMEKVVFESCQTPLDVSKYARNKTVHFLHLKNPERFDKPKELSEFGIEKAPQSWCYIEVEK